MVQLKKETVDQDITFESQLDNVLETISLKDCFAHVPKEIKTIAEFMSLNEVLSTYLDLMEQSVQECDDDPNFIQFRKEAIIYVKYWRAMQYKEMSSCNQDNVIKIKLLKKSLNEFNMLKRDHFKMSDIRQDLSKFLVGKSESIYR